MTLIPTPLPARGPPVTALQNALSALGFGIPSGELGSGDNGVFGPVTRAAVDTFRAKLRAPADRGPGVAVRRLGGSPDQRRGPGRGGIRGGPERGGAGVDR